MKSLPKQKACHIFLVIFFVIFYSFKISAQTSDTDTTISDGKLQWNYYTGQKDDSSNFWAMTYWGVYYKYSVLFLSGDTVRILLQVRTVLKKKSWVLPDKKSNELLQHEQGHFNFAVLCAREFNKVTSTTTFFRSTYTQNIDSVFTAILKKYKQMEIQYDEETNHMLDKKEQRLWNKKLEEMLDQ